MRKLWLVCLLVPCMGFAQNRLHLTLFGGVTNYQGDLQFRRFTMDQSYGAFGLGFKYDLGPHLALRSGIVYGKLGGDDKRNKPALQPRNLSFQSKIFEGNVLVQYDVFDLQTRRFSPYAFAGLGIYHFNPYAFDSLGARIYLQPLGTEGQGLALYPDRKMYKRTQLAIPFGGGIQFRVTGNIVLGYEIGLRKLFTDYLDDVSTRYADQFALAQVRGPKAVEMAYRADELKDGDPVYPPDGTIRGGSKYKDWYYFQGITVTIGINTGNGGVGGSGRRGNTSCPTRVL